MPTSMSAALIGALAMQAAPVSKGELTTFVTARQSLVGLWQGTLEYRDYKADRWFGLPVKVEVKDGGDGVTLMRVADFDDGPTTGVVRITTVSMLSADGLEETNATFRKGRAVELSKAKLVFTKGEVAGSWVLVEDIEGTDDNRPAKIRLTTTRTGSKLVTLKQVDFSDDTKVEWLVRNRTTLEKSP